MLASQETLAEIRTAVVAGIPASPRIFSASSSFPRAANTTAYAALDMVATHAAPASVVPLEWTVSDVADAPVSIERATISTPDTGPGTAGAWFELWVWRAAPTVAAASGDNLAFSANLSGAVGWLSGQFVPYADGSFCELAPKNYVSIITAPSTGGRSLYGLAKTLTAFTPSANSLVYTVQLFGLQGRS